MIILFQLKANIQLNQSLVANSSSLGNLLAKTVNQIVSPLTWLEKVRIKLQYRPIPVFCLQKKFQLAWYFLILNSQKSPPTKLPASHEAFDHIGMSCVTLKVDFRLFKPLILPKIGRDENLLRLIFRQALTFVGIDNRSYHRSIVSTSAQIRSTGYGVFFLTLRE